MSKRILDEAMKAALLGVSPLSSSSKINFTPPVFSKIEIKDEFKPVFQLRGLTVEEKQLLDELVSSSVKADNDKEAWNKKAFALTKGLIVGWQNVFEVGTGDELDFIGESGSCTSSLFDMLPVIIKNQLFSRVMQMHGLMDTTKMGLQ
jgi:hypothetical protein